jgi:hypothetical protein
MKKGCMVNLLIYYGGDLLVNLKKNVFFFF